MLGDTDVCSFCPSSEPHPTVDHAPHLPLPPYPSPSPPLPHPPSPAHFPPSPPTPCPAESWRMLVKSKQIRLVRGICRGPTLGLGVIWGGGRGRGGEGRRMGWRREGRRVGKRGGGRMGRHGGRGRAFLAECPGRAAGQSGPGGSKPEPLGSGSGPRGWLWGGPRLCLVEGGGSSGVSSSRTTEPTRGSHGLNLGVNFGETQICCPK